MTDCKVNAPLPADPAAETDAIEAIRSPATAGVKATVAPAAAPSRTPVQVRPVTAAPAAVRPVAVTVTVSVPPIAAETTPPRPLEAV